MYKSKTEKKKEEDLLPQDWLISQPDLKRAQKINLIEFSLLFICITIIQASD